MAAHLPDLCISGDVRLMDQAKNVSHTGKGRVEMCVGGNWGTICGLDWGQEEAIVVCNELGFNSSGTFDKRSTNSSFKLEHIHVYE